MEANSILRAAVGMRKTAEIAKITKTTKTVQHLQRRTLSEIYIRKIPEEDVSDRKKTEIKNKVKRKHLQEYPKGISDISEVKRDVA